MCLPVLQIIAHFQADTSVRPLCIHDILNIGFGIRLSLPIFNLQNILIILWAVDEFVDGLVDFV